MDKDTIIKEIINIRGVDGVQMETKTLEPLEHFTIMVIKKEISEEDLIKVFEKLNGQKLFNWTLIME